jgi:hypothetical protein
MKSMTRRILGPAAAALAICFIASVALAGTSVSFTVTSGSLLGELIWAGGAGCPASTGLSSGGAGSLTTSTGTAGPPNFDTTYGGSGFTVECDGTLPGAGGGGGDAVQIITTFTGTTSFDVDTSNYQTYQLGNNYTVEVTELNSPFRTCTSGAVNGNYEVDNSGALTGFPTAWPTENAGAATPAVSGTLAKDAFGNGAPSFPSCGGWGPTLNAAFANGVSGFFFTYSMGY